MPASPSSLPSLARRVARDTGLEPGRVAGALALFDDGATLPFVARYRKEATGGLDEVELRAVQERASYLRELDERRAAVRSSIREQGGLTGELDRRLREATTKQEIEDLYLPWRPRRRTRATRARERGLEPLADLAWSGGADDGRLRREAKRFVDPGKEVPDPGAALDGARDILAERIAEDASLRAWIRDRLRSRGRVVSRLARGRKAEESEVARFRDYLDHAEPVRRIPPHRILAIRRGEAEGILSWSLEAPDDVPARVRATALRDREARAELERAADDAWRRLLAPSLESEVKRELTERADEEAIRVFGANLEQLLLQPPAGRKVVLGLDPGFRTGVKAAVVSSTGAVLDTAVLPLHQRTRFASELTRLLDEHGPELVAVGNGTASRETEAAVGTVMADREGPLPPVVTVNEAGASVYSASELAGEELPDLDVSLRGAVSIARRLQDPLAELVKIDPRSIGVGQYQHDVDQARLGRRLDETVERCVHRVGVEVNTASPALLRYVAGIGPALARGIVELRDERGGLRSRQELLEVHRLGPRSFEQAAGFLRIRDGTDPLDATAVHPERYELVDRMARELGVRPAELVEDDELVDRLESRLSRYVGEEVGLPTLEDIVAELRRRGRDPRDTFEPPRFREDVRTPEDLEPGMVLPGVVTNVVGFGAFVDVGVHQDGLVHISQLADRFVRDPAEVVRVGQRVRVRVLEVDLERGRIGLSMKAPA